MKAVKPSGGRFTSTSEPGTGCKPPSKPKTGLRLRIRRSPPECELLVAGSAPATSLELANQVRAGSVSKDQHGLRCHPIRHVRLRSRVGAREKMTDWKILARHQRSI